MKKVLMLIMILGLSLPTLPTVTQAKSLINAPFIRQLPELPRGCEVTSLAMMLQFAGVNVDKMTLAKEIKKVPYYKDGYMGNPYDGFVGNMYTRSQPGFGVYHGPIVKLAEKYLPNQIIDLTGQEVSKIYEMIILGRPVWVISNTRFRHLPSSRFNTWYTSSGKIKITTSEHSVLVTGYDSKSVYINDPLYHKKNRKVNRKSFEASWIQMGSQAVSYFTEEDKFYADTKNHWTKNAIEFVRTQGYMSGYSDYFFGPEDFLTRGQVVAVLDRFLPADIKASNNNLSFSDISNHFAETHILNIANAGLIGGYADGTFKPDENITRAQLAAILAKIAPIENLKEKIYIDVDSSNWAYNGIQTVQQLGLIKGSSDGYFFPDQPVKRGELAVIIERLHHFMIK